MYNPYFKKDVLQKSVNELKLPLELTGAFVSRVGLLIPSETQTFSPDFYNIKKTAEKLIKAEPGLPIDHAIRAIIDDAKLLYTLNDIPFLVERKPQPSKATNYTPSLFLRMQNNRRRDPGAKITQATIDMLAIPAIDKLPPGAKRVHEYMDPGELDKIISAPEKITPRPRAALGSHLDGRSKYQPTDQELADGGRAFMAANTGYSPQGRAKGNEFLPVGSKAWTTLFGQYLLGDNALGKIMERCPPISAEIENTVPENSMPASEAAPTPTGQFGIAALPPAPQPPVPAAPENPAKETDVPHADNVAERIAYNSYHVTAAFGETTSRGKYVPTLREISAAAYKVEEKTGNPPKDGKEFLPPNSVSWSTLIVHYLRGENTLPRIMNRYPPGSEETVVAAPVVQGLSLTAKTAGSEAPEDAPLRAAFNPLSTQAIEPYETEIANLNPRHLAVLAAIKDGCKQSELLTRTNDIYQATGQLVLTQMFPGAVVTPEEFFPRDVEFYSRLRAELLEIVVAEKEDTGYGASALDHNKI